MSLYRLYIDEVGNHDMNVATVTNPKASAAGFRCFSSEEDFRHYVEVEIMALEPA